MMRIFWDEWRSGGAFSSVRLLPVVVLVAAAAMLVTREAPGSLFIVFTLAALAGGYVSGTQRWNTLLAADWAAEGGGALGYLAGKTLGLLAVWGAWGLYLLPLGVLVTIVWSLPAEPVAMALAWGAAAGLGAQALSKVLTVTASEFLRFLAAILVFLWVAVSVQVPWLQPINPLWQVWRVFHDPGAPFDLGAFLLVLGGAAVLWLPSLLLLKGNRS